MSTYLHTLTYVDLVDRLPGDLSNVSASSSGVNTSQLGAYLEEGAGVVNGLLERGGFSPESLDDEATQVARAAILVYAERLTLVRLGATESRIRLAGERWREHRDQILNLPSTLGDEHNAASSVQSNVDTTDPTPKRWTGSAFKGW